MKLALGTVQFGLDYGVSNKQGQVSDQEIADILTLAAEHKIDTLDCASAYGNSEEKLGQTIQAKQFKLVTKIPSLTPTEQSILPYFKQSLTKLKRRQIDTLLLHDVSNLLAHPHAMLFINELKQLKATEQVKRIGVSVYSPKQISDASKLMPLDVIQAPMNLLDQRLCLASTSDLFASATFKLHIRSAFLQGLILMEQDTWPTYFKPFYPLLRKINEASTYYGVSNLTLALAFLVQNSLKNNEIGTHIEKIVVGVCSAQQLTEIIVSYEQAKNMVWETNMWQAFASEELALIDPSKWKVS